MSLYQEKMRQACQIVQEEGVDVWLIIARETVMNNDPVLQLISPVDFGGHDLCVHYQRRTEYCPG